MLSFNGVCVRCAHPALGLGCGMPAISVDTHVHRITSRRGLTATLSPEEINLAPEKSVPKPKWIRLNELLVPFGKLICTPLQARCSACPVLGMRQQVGVSAPR